MWFHLFGYFTGGNGVGMHGEKQCERETCELNMIEPGAVEEVLHAASDVRNDQPLHVISLRGWPETGNPNSCRTQL